MSSLRLPERYPSKNEVLRDEWRVEPGRSSNEFVPSHQQQEQWAGDSCKEYANHHGFAPCIFPGHKESRKSRYHKGQSSRSKEYLHGKWVGCRRLWGWRGRLGNIGFRSVHLRPVSFCGRGWGGLSGRKVQGSLLMQLRKMSQNGGRNVGTPAARLVQSEHLKASRDGEKKDRRGEEHANVMVC